MWELTRSTKGPNPNPTPTLRGSSRKFPQIRRISIDEIYDFENKYQYHNNQFIENSPAEGFGHLRDLFSTTLRKIP
ncbi:hypothetical protein EHQ12_16530 [Leptospira gomenensis]|uniref:Uncharacterized protein n=1 Tax=Leptospira gomenensis TaxID=2484974 RepID=A0A5F1YKP7_9LEPT|nr:hypothetical protein EHQ12_16530 [Leptospira gomenensis]TGK37304.1 hypothetical protein EHQ17_03730 [Leptospira gomenensis]TGK50991.1 hypothetical protein EHQ07_03795 [Leptospira gomenensis]TGK56613.1 hypothetical protein EHQ13_15720 [Leptospira gomenensis]